MQNAARVTLEPPPGFYVLAATVCDPIRSESIRAGLRALVRTGQQRLHWYAETPRRRDHLIETITGLDLAHLAVVAPAEASKQERARRKCLERLLYELDQLGVSQTWLESRQRAQDSRDLQMVEAVRGTRLISRTLTVDFARPLDEPML